MISALPLLLVMLQASDETAVAIRPDQPQTWSLEYPILISPHVDAYYNCLRSSEVKIGKETNFETQHRNALVTCEKTLNKSVKRANDSIKERGRPGQDTPAKVANVFTTLGLIHVARGKDLDDQMKIGLGSNAYGQRVTAKGAVVSDEAHAPLDDAVWDEERKAEADNGAKTSANASTKTGTDSDAAQQ